MHIVRRFTDPADREVVGFCASALAFGRVASVLQSIERLIAIMQPSPADFVRRFDAVRDTSVLELPGHRWIRGADLAALILILQHMLKSGSVEAFFLQGYDASAADVGAALDSFSTRALSTDLAPAYRDRTPRPGAAYFFSRPSCGGACKRLNLFLRWMVRHDAVDFGLWSHVSPSKLIVPLDTHVIRVGRCLRLTRYSSAGWRMAADITASLRRLDPADPVKYDFSLCHVGMADQCGFNRSQSDVRCPLRGFCRPRRPSTTGKPRASARPSGRR